MRYQNYHFYYLWALLFLSTWTVITVPTTAKVLSQEDVPAPQFLYRDDDRLILLDGYTGEPTPLAIEVSPGDRFGWSPDGQFLISWLQDFETETPCLNLYKVDEQAWLSDDPIACPVERIRFFDDGQQLFYVTPDEYNATLWRYNLTEGSKQELYRTTGGDSPNDTGISSLIMSPTGAYLTFEVYDWIMGGTRNSLVIMNMSTWQTVRLSAPNPYYASYYPIWSEDDSWFLITMKHEYVASAGMPETNHRGDIYLVNSNTGETYRLTFTPAEFESDIHWTEEGDIAFTTIIEENHLLSIDEAMHVETIPYAEMVMPEDVEIGDRFANITPQDIILSPDPNLGAWVEEADTQPMLTIGSFWNPRTAYFSVPIADSSLNTLIGWRPTNYNYPNG